MPCKKSQSDFTFTIKRHIGIVPSIGVATIHDHKNHIYDKVTVGTLRQLISIISIRFGFGFHFLSFFLLRFTIIAKKWDVIINLINQLIVDEEIKLLVSV